VPYVPDNPHIGVPASLLPPTDTHEHTEEQRLAEERAEAERIDAERRAAQQAEDERLAQLGTAVVESEEPPLDQPQLEAQEPSLDVDEHWFQAERAEAERIDAERAVAQQAEDERLERLRTEELRRGEEQAERAERDRLEGVRAAAEQAERERLATLRSAETRLRAQNDQLVEETAPTPVPAEPTVPGTVETRPAPTEAPAATPATPRTRPAPAPAGTTEPVPRFVEFRSTSVLRYVFGAFFVVFAVAAVIAIFRAVSPGDSSLVMAAVGLTALAMLSWWALLSWAPPIVSVSDGTLEIARGTRSSSWDLRDPSTEITFRGRPSSRAWRAVLRDRTGSSTTIAARQVDPAQFVELVEHYQSLGRP
jgi:hypothetical protein